MGIDNHKNPPAWRAFMSLRVNGVRTEIQKLGTLLVLIFVLYLASLYSRPGALAAAGLLLAARLYGDWGAMRRQEGQVRHIERDEELDL
jgi:hypothetical protein